MLLCATPAAQAPASPSLHLDTRGCATTRNFVQACARIYFWSSRRSHVCMSLLCIIDAWYTCMHLQWSPRQQAPLDPPWMHAPLQLYRLYWPATARLIDLSPSIRRSCMHALFDLCSRLTVTVAPHRYLYIISKYTMRPRCLSMHTYPHWGPALDYSAGLDPYDIPCARSAP